MFFLRLQEQSPECPSAYVTCPLKIICGFPLFSRSRTEVFSLTYQPSEPGLCSFIFSSYILFPHDLGEAAPLITPTCFIPPPPCMRSSRPWNSFPFLLHRAHPPCKSQLCCHSTSRVLLDTLTLPWHHVTADLLHLFVWPFVQCLSPVLHSKFQKDRDHV